MTRKRKEKNIIISQEAYNFLKSRYEGRIPYKPTIIKDKLFITTVKDDKDEKQI